MPAADHPIDALRRHFELEDSSMWPLAEALTKANSLPLPPLLQQVLRQIADRFAADAQHRVQVMLETMGEEIKKQDQRLRTLEQDVSGEQQKHRVEEVLELVVDGARRAAGTRSLERVRHIGLILANSAADPKPLDADEVEEMMRVAMELGDNEVRYLRELVRIEGSVLDDRVARPLHRIERWEAHNRWEQGFWGNRINNEIDSVFSKLESYGLVSRIPPPNNLNIQADFQNRYVLLKKGLRFVEWISRMA